MFSSVVVDVVYYYFNGGLPLKTHPYHLVDLSPWPLHSAVAGLALVAGFVATLNRLHVGSGLLILGLINLVGVSVCWFRDITREGTFGGYHTLPVRSGLFLGFTFFLVSEVMLFFSFFWAFFYSASNPAVEIGGVWPPTGIEPMSPTGIPLLNTLLLVWSGLTLTYAHNRLIAEDLPGVNFGLIVTMGLGLIFLTFQLYEYAAAEFDFSDGIYGSCFYLLTGFHGFHVLIGFLFLGSNLARSLNWHYHFGPHLGFTFGVWYWHFVDVVWLFLYVSLYIWGNN